MAVYQPSAFLGNGHVLITLGRSGELMGFFYPRCDYPNNVREGLTGLFHPKAGFIWLFDDRWKRSQKFLSPFHVRTTLLWSDGSLSVTLDDRLDQVDPVLHRTWIVNSPPSLRGLRLFHYFELTCGGASYQQAVQVLRAGSGERPVILQWFQSIWCAVRGDPAFSIWQCGKSHRGSYNHPKDALVTGRLTGQSLEIGAVGFAVASPEVLTDGAPSVHTVTIGFGRSKSEVLLRTAKAGTGKTTPKSSLTVPGQTDSEGTVTDWDLLTRTYRASQGILHCLWDRKAHAPIAAPEFDPTFEASGGYGYCWFRDSAFIVDALIRIRRWEDIDHFFTFCTSAQSEEGYFHQRCWLDGTLAPAWSEDHDALQLDQTALIVWVADRYERETGSVLGDPVYCACQRALSFLENRLLGGLHQPGHDLWETFQGTFTFTQGSIVAAFRSGAQMAHRRKRDRQAGHWQRMAKQAKRALLGYLWAGKGFLRGICGGREDPTPDASVLGLIFPLEILSFSEPEERKMAETALEQTLQHLSVPTAEGGLAVYRFAGDGYAGGMASTPATLWLGLAALAFYGPKGSRDLSRRVLTACYSHTTEAGFLAEMFTPVGSGFWAAGHGWSAGWFLILCHRLGFMLGEGSDFLRYHKSIGEGGGGDGHESRPKGFRL